ncbi:uncharacterized protein LOC127529674 isoform X2 [Erpetoichthys calabaricus]|uniref:uncharacterized protein LOC127529674 isoform X2 n=1 Tax=Erpetoichthys calabaricus TaxID=27687 RepID=UPI002234D464|nr:uncharacterized protein LOC127529674 isoform X2 [Erpetoichthys calabaricus]
MGTYNSKPVNRRTGGSKSLMLEELFSEDQQTPRKNGSPRKFIEKKTGLDFKKACKKWNRQSGGRWPIEGTGDVSEIQEVRKILCRNKQGCYNSGPYRMDMFDRWELVIKDRNLEAVQKQNDLLRANEGKAKKEKEELLITLQKVQIDTEPQADGRKRKNNPNKDPLYPIIFSPPQYQPQAPPLSPPLSPIPTAPPALQLAEVSPDDSPGTDHYDSPCTRQTPVSKCTRSHKPAPTFFSSNPSPSLTCPLIEVSNPHYNPAHPAGPQNPTTVMINRNWDIQELKDVVNALPDPKEVGGLKFVEQLDQLDSMYKPNAAEWTQVLRRKLGTTWATVSRGVRNDVPWVWDPALTRGQGIGGEGEFNPQWEALRQNIAEKYKKGTDWSLISAAKQKRDETVDEWAHRIQDLMANHSGLGNADDRTRAALSPFVSGLRLDIQNKVRTSCIEWESATFDEVKRHAEHAESDSHAKLLAAQMNYYSRNAPDQGRGYGFRGRGRGRGRGGFRAPPVDHTKNPFIPSPLNSNANSYSCHACGKTGHFRRECPHRQQQPPPPLIPPVFSDTPDQPYWP